MSDPYQRVKPGRLAFKDGTLATRAKTIDKKKRKKKKDKNPNLEEGETLENEKQQGEEASAAGGEGEGEEVVYTIDAAKRMKYEQLFPVEAKKFAYDPKSANHKSVEDALDDRVKKKADRYCK